MFLAPVPLLIGIIFFALAITSDITIVAPNTYSGKKRPALDEMRPLTHEESTTDRQRDAVEKAVRNAHRPHAGRMLADIGLLAYDETNKPRLCRTSDIPTNTTHIRPYIALEPARHKHDVVILFKVFNGAGEPCFQSRSAYQVKRGNTFITPKNWLPLSDQALESTWALEVSFGDDAPFAIHEFDWLEIGGDVRAEFNGDGEIDEKMRTAINQALEEPMSLSELIADQPESLVKRD
jgi:hypothetical protein